MGGIYNIFFVLVLCLGIAYAATCTDTNLPAVPGYPTDTIPSTPATSATNPLTTNHWSETARLGLFRDFDAITTQRSNCPHQRSGLKNWHDASTWSSGSVPRNGADVTIPANTQVLISSCSIDPTFTLGIITVPRDSSLIIGDATINIRARGFNVEGALLAGSETCRLRNKVNITLVGSRPGTVPADAPVKGISVQGTIDLHGALYTPTWTRLAMTARINDTVIFVQDIVNWQAGQRIVITTSELKDSRDWHRNEERTIKSVKLTAHNTVSAIELTEPLQYKHFGGREYQVEVALLSRNILVQGSEADSEATDTANSVCTDGGSTRPCENSYLTGWGAHIFVNGLRAQGRFSGVELFRAGQTNSLGRYPIHFHMMGDHTANNYTSAYVRDSSVHRSYFRCYAIHGTNGVKLTQNTAYDAIGHCYFLEDGAEEENILSYNQAAHIHPLGKYWEFTNENNFWGQGLPTYYESPTLILPSDMAAGCFYITNAYNDVYGNAASGGFAGFSLPSLNKLVKMFNGNLTIGPSVRPFRSAFRGNSAHSTGYWWASAGGIYVGGQLMQEGTTFEGRLSYTAGRSLSRDTCSRKTARIRSDDGCWSSGDRQLWLRFEDNKVFLANRGLQNWGDRSELIRFEFHDVVLSMNVFGSVWIDQMLMNCRNPNNNLVRSQGCSGSCNIRDTYFAGNMAGFQWYDVSQKHILTNSIFRNCNGNNVAVFSSLTHSDEFVPEQMQITNQIKFQNCTERRWRYSTSMTSNPGLTVSGKNQNWYDHDGSVTGLQVKSMIGSARMSEWWKYSSECVLQDEAYKCPMKPGDSAASVFFNYGLITDNGVNITTSDIGDGKGKGFCLNGGARPFGTSTDPTPRNLCTVVGKVSHFGTSESLGYDLGGNPKVTGPIINAKGGWFVRFTYGTPAKLVLSGIQVKPEDALILAFPYPSNTQFNIYHKGASWCGGNCRHQYTQVDSIAKVRASFGDAYFWDNARRTLYMRVISADPTFPNPDVPQWNTSRTYSDTFTRGGFTILTSAYQTYIYIEATNCGGRCAPQNDVQVPAALNNPSPPTTNTASITGSTISQPASSIGTAAAGSSTGTVGVVSTSKASSTGSDTSGPSDTTSPSDTTAGPSDTTSSPSGGPTAGNLNSGAVTLGCSLLFVLLAIFALVLA